MKIRRLLFIFSLTFSGFVFSQTQEDVEKITKNYDLEKLKELQVSYKKKEAAEKKAAYEAAKRNGWPIIIEKDGVYQELMKLTPDGFPLYYATESNVIAARSTRANYLNTGGGLGLTLDGQNMVARVWDGGPVRRLHSAFYTSSTNTASRITNVDVPFTTSNSNTNHGTHVAGTILALPWNATSAPVRGMAPQATGRSFDWTDDESEAISEVALGMLVSNHSYGVPVTGTNGPLPSWYIGSYVEDSRVWDEIAYNSPFYLPVYSAGNDGNNNDNADPISGGLDKLVGNKVAKNVLTIANAQDATIAVDGSLTSVNINSGSSQGPTDDRRIKPDIAGNGTGLVSPISTNNTATADYSGTSMAAPNVTGSLLLLQQHYKNVTTSFMRSATLKGLACHTADDAGEIGPDPYFGWGLLNAKKAAETITNNGLSSWISEQRLNQGQTFTMTVRSNGGANNPLIASITWTDLPGEANNGQRLVPNDLFRSLVNDLDIRVTRNGTTFFPWKLNSTDPLLPATRVGDNNLDNVELVRIDSPAAGDYVITITHKGNLVTGGQNYSLVVTGISSSFGLISKSNDVVLCSTANASYTFDYKQSGAGTTNFTATGVPAGATVSFTPASLSANGTVTMNVTNLGSVTPGLYDIGIVGNNGTETETRIKSLRVFSSTFTPITLTSPLNGFNGTPTSINLDWQDDNNAESYLVQVSTNSTFTTTVVNQVVQESNFIASNLNQDTVYYWRVVPSNRCGSATNASAIVNSFKTGIISCGNIFNATDFSDATIATTANVTASVPINVSGGIIIGDLKVTLDISHTWIGDMIISLEGPASIGSPEIILLNQPCTGSGSTYPNILATLDEAGTALVCEATSPVVRGIAAPFESFTAFNGLNADGVWTLKVSDVGNNDGGAINAVSLNFCNVVPGTLSSNDNVLGSLKVYPNPAKGIVNIDLGNVTGDTTYELFDVQGRKVISKVSSSNFETLNIENLSEGIYMLSIQNGGAKTTKKLVINK